MVEFFIYKTNGAFTTKALSKHLVELKDGRYSVKIEKAHKRSEQQNRYYFGLVVPLMQKAFKDLGHELSQQETHEFLKAKFNSFEVVNHDTGEAVSVPKSTTKLSKLEFSEYIEKIQRFAAEFLNTQIPNPGEQLGLLDDIN